MSLLTGILISILFLVPIAWLTSEFHELKRPLRISLGLISMIAMCCVAYGVGSLGSEFSTNAYFAHSNTQLIDATIRNLEANRQPQVLAAHKTLREQYHPNYENRSHYDTLVDEAVRQMENAPPPASAASALTSPTSVPLPR